MLNSHKNVKRFKKTGLHINAIQYDFQDTPWLRLWGLHEKNWPLSRSSSVTGGLFAAYAVSRLKIERAATSTSTLTLAGQHAKSATKFCQTGEHFKSTWWNTLAKSSANYARGHLQATTNSINTSRNQLVGSLDPW